MDEINIEYISRFAADEYVEVIIKYNGDISILTTELNAFVEILTPNFAIVTLHISQVAKLYTFPQIQYIELPKELSYVLLDNLVSICVPPIQNPNIYGLRGNGVLVALIDSGIDLTHPDFQNPDGTSRVVYLWDQTIPGKPPNGFRSGSEYNNNDINLALANPSSYNPFPAEDIIGHGTAVAGIMAGNGASSNQREIGVAPNASIIVVKLDNDTPQFFTKTTEVMRGIKYVVDKSLELQMPLVINLSYGTSEGAHDGNSLFERFIDDMSNIGKTSICVATGNEGASRHHYSTMLSTGEIDNISFSLSAIQSQLYITAWKDFADDITFELVAPNGRSTGPITALDSLTRFYTTGAQVTILYLQPNRYNVQQEIYFNFNIVDGAAAIGTWHIIATGVNIVNGQLNIWLPTIENISENTAFLTPNVNNTITIPSTARSVISVGGYNSTINTFAVFSGRGPLMYNGKPDLVAPAVNILTTKTRGGYDTFTGTSMASPFVAGCAALMMEWGIVRGNDVFLYGQRIRAFLHKGSHRLVTLNFPNNRWGYGILNLCDTMDSLVEFNQYGGDFF